MMANIWGKLEVPQVAQVLFLNTQTWYNFPDVLIYILYDNNDERKAAGSIIRKSESTAIKNSTPCVIVAHFFKVVDRTCCSIAMYKFWTLLARELIEIMI